MSKLSTDNFDSILTSTIDSIFSAANSALSSANSANTYVANTTNQIQTTLDNVGAAVYATINDLPLSNNESGALAIVSSTNVLYFWNGSGWYKIALINQTPTITANSAASYTLTAGTNTVIQLAATDPEEVPITWSYSVTSGLIQDTSVVVSGNTFTIVPGSTATTFDLTFTASDGINTDTSTSSFSLSFSSYPNMSGVTAYSMSTTVGNAVVMQYFKYYLSFNSDGTKMGAFDQSNQGIHYHTPTLSPAYTPTASGGEWNWIPVPTGYSGTWGYSGPYWNNDGTKFFILGNSSTTFIIHEYSITSAYNFAATATFVRTKAITLSTYTDAYYQVKSITFSEDGSKLGAFDNFNFNLFSMSTAWDISTLSFVSKASHGNNTDNFSGGYMVPNGTGIFTTSKNPNRYVIFKRMSTAFDTSTLGTSITKQMNDEIHSVLPVPPSSYNKIILGTVNSNWYQQSVTSWTGIVLP